jgi:hypothetical protein
MERDISCETDRRSGGKEISFVERDGSLPCYQKAHHWPVSRIS